MSHCHICLRTVEQASRGLPYGTYPKLLTELGRYAIHQAVKNCNQKEILS